MLETIVAKFSTFYKKYFRLRANMEFGPERAEVAMFTLNPGSDRRLLNRSFVRSGVHIHNLGPGTVYVSFGTEEAATDAFSILLPVDTSYDERGWNIAPQVEIRATADMAGTQIMVTETRRVIGLAPSPREVLDTAEEA